MQTKWKTSATNTAKGTDRSIFFKMDVVIKKARNIMDQTFESAGIDLTVDQWILVERLQAISGLTQHQLAEESGKDAGTTTRILNILDKKGYTVRNPVAGDRRSLEVALTAKGKRLYDRAVIAVVEVRKQGFAQLSAMQLELFNRMLDRIYAEET